MTGWMGLGFPPGVGLWRGGVGPVCAAEWASLLGRLARGVLLLFFFFLFVFSFVFSFFYLFSFLFLNHFKLLRHFIKMGLLHHNYLCNIWYKPNIFILMFENFYCLT